jgi:hypothetical protein
MKQDSHKKSNFDIGVKSLLMSPANLIKHPELKNSLKTPSFPWSGAEIGTRFQEKFAASSTSSPAVAGTGQSPRPICLPNGMLQETYNPDATNTIWSVGRNAPTRGEDFRVRINVARLRARRNWRVQRIRVSPTIEFIWDD